MPSTYNFPLHNFRIAIRPRPTFVLETHSSCNTIYWRPPHCLYSIQNDAFTITDIHGQGGLWRFFYFILTSRFGIFQKPITLSPEKASVIVLIFRHRASCIQDRRFATLQRTLFIYLINKYISLSDICLTVHHWYK